MLQTIEPAVARTARKSKAWPEISKTIGISAVATYERPWVLDNDWFADTLLRKFVQHTGILSRRIGCEDEVTLGVRAVERLEQQTDGDPAELPVGGVCRSSIHRGIARRYLNAEQARREDFQAAAREWSTGWVFRGAAVGINWAAAGYAKAMEVAARLRPLCPAPAGPVPILVVTANRTSKITDYALAATWG